VQSRNPFPLSGVIGVVANTPDEIDLAVEKSLQCVEIRADLLLDSGLTIDALPSVVKRARHSGLAVLFTLRHPAHGGKFIGTEDDRAAINRQALTAGADIIDLEWDQTASAIMLAEDAPVVLSYHDFNSMPDDTQLASLTQKMCESRPWAIKIVPTASTLADPVRMLRWSDTSTDDTIVRIGFAMGQIGSCSRILTTTYGAPITYASFGEAVAPGQVALDDLLNGYRVTDLNNNTRVVAVVGDDTTSMRAVVKLNESFRSEQSNTVAINFGTTTTDELNTFRDVLRIIDIHTAA